MGIVKNDFVGMDWDSEKFFESEKGFIAAVQTYVDKDGNEVNVIFMDKKAFVLTDIDTGNSFDMIDVKGAIEDSVNEGIAMEDFYPDNYSELGNVVVDSSMINAWGLSRFDEEDINKRLDDLSGYWETTEV